MTEDRSGYLKYLGLGLGLIILIAFLHPFDGGGATTTTTTGTYTTSNPSAMTFALNDQSIGYGIPGYKDNMQVQQADLAMLESTGASCIRADIGYGPWLSGDSSTQSIISQMAAAIKSAGKCLILADAASESYRNGGCLNWVQFKAAWVQRVSTLAALYHPDYYITVKEPGWYVPMVCDAKSNPDFANVSDWLGLTQNLTGAVRAASPSTVVGVAIAADSLNNQNAFYTQYLNGVQVGFIGFDIYTASGQTATTNYLTSNPPTKAVWIAEWWATPLPSGADASQALKSEFAFAQQIGAKTFIPFYTDLFSGYPTPTDTTSLVAFYQGRTSAYTEFKNLVASYP